MVMQITIKGAKYAPSWEHTETLIRGMLNTDVHDEALENGRLIRIARTDGKVNYRALGEYEIDYRTKFETIRVKLIVA